jgi:VWFA-related protein
VNVRNEAAGLAGNRTFRTLMMVTVLAVGCLTTLLVTSSVQAVAQDSGSQAQAPAQGKPAQDTDIPDAPTVQPNSEPAEAPAIPKPEEKKPAVDLNPWTNQPNQPNKPATNPNAFPEDDGANAPTMPPVGTVPTGSVPKPRSKAEDLGYAIRVTTNFVQLPVTVTDDRGRMVDGLLSNDFVVKENGTVQKLTFFSADPLSLSVAIVLDLGMPDIDVQKVNQTFGALVGAFSPYDEVSLYTYSSTVSQVSDFMAASQKMMALLNQMKTERGHNNGPAVLGGPMANGGGPVINGIPVGSPTAPVNTPPKEAHVLNDAILQAALGLRKRDRARRKIILVISDGREFGSEASYNDVKRVLLSNEIQVKGIAVDAGALPAYSKLERLHLPRQGYDDILPKYVAATGGQPLYKELSRNAIEEIYATAMSEARNQYTLGYVPAKPKVPTTGSYRNIEVVVHRPGLKIYAKDGYYPAIAAAR